MSVQFLRHILPSRGWYAGLALGGKTPHTKWTENVEELYAWLLQQSEQGLDAYHAIAAFKCEGDRKHANVRAVRTLLFDTDTKVTKPHARYETPLEAAQAIGAFINELQLPRPAVVPSGGGLHGYLTLEEELTLAEWTQLALRFKAAARAHDVDMDPARTADASSIMRTPGTRHQKAGVLVGHPVLHGPHPLERFKILEQYHVAGHRIAAAPRTGLTAFAASAANVESPTDRDANRIADHCRQIGEMRATLGNLPEPTWFDCLGVLVHCKLGDSIAHKWSSGHPNYSFAETEGRLARKHQLTGPTKCEQFTSTNPKGCEGCPYKGLIGSPLELGTERFGSGPAGVAPINGHKVDLDKVGLSELSDVAMPEPFLFDDAGRLVQRVYRNGQADDTVIARHPIYLSHIYRTETTDRHWYGFRQKYEAGWKDVALPASMALGPRGEGALADLGAAIREPKLFTVYIRRAVEEMNGHTEMQYEQYGWKHGGEFLAGTRLYTPEGVTRVACSEEARTRAQWLGPSPFGSLAQWSHAANYLTRGKPLFQLGVCASFAAPLMAFHQDVEGGVLVNLMSRESATGKTGNLIVGSSVWGLHRALEVKKEDTPAAKGLTFAALGNLPIVFDEIALIHENPLRNPEAVKNFVMFFAGGRDKARAMVNGQSIHHVQAIWRTIMLTASNHSLNDLLSVFGNAPEAPRMRVMEFLINYKTDGDSAEIDRMKLVCQENCGHAGDEFARLIVGREYNEFIRKTLPAWTKQIWQDKGLPPAARFWARGLGAIMVAAQICRNQKILNVDPHEIVDAGLDSLLANADFVRMPKRPPRKIKEEEEPVAELDAFVSEAVELLTQWIYQHQGQTLVMPRAWKHGDRSIEPTTRPREIHARYEQDPPKLYINKQRFRRWVVDQGFVWTQVIRALAQESILLDTNRLVTLTAGTGLPGGQTYCCDVDMGHPRLSVVPRVINSTPDFQPSPAPFAG